MRWILMMALLGALTACDDGGGADAGDDASSTDDAGDATDDGVGNDDAAADACVPAPCAADACGPRPDGCGGINQCEAGCACQGDGCACVTGDDCAARPCEVARCDAGACAYDAVTCGDAVCECAAEPCEDAEPRPCGDGCDAQVCDPSPDGAGRFLNRCVPIDALPCGACGISTTACDPVTGDLSCDDLIPVEAAQGRRCEQLVLFVDRAWDGPERGTREAPFQSLAAALDLAALADIGFVIIGGSGEVTGPVVLRDGVELRGGFSGHPFFQPSADRPTLRAMATPNAIGDGQIVALTALDVTTGSAVRGIDIVVDAAPPAAIEASDDATSGVHTLGLVAIDSPALIVEGVEIRVGAASAGVPGADAVPVEADLDPALMNGPKGIDEPGSLGTGACDEFRDEVCDVFPNACEQPCANPNPLGPVIPGTRGAWGAVCPADLDGVRSQTNPGGPAGQLLTVCVGNSPGSRPAWPEGQINRRAGAPGAVGGRLDALDRWRSVGAGAAGLPGIGGRPGAGGRSEGNGGCHFGAAGGGGGAGGCGGFGGRPGGGGGSAIGLLLVRSTGVQIVDVMATVDDGGAGAPGGLGSAGLPGGQGGAPGLDERGRASGARAGEPGGAGHPGGPGGNGAGGDSAGVFCVETAVDLPPAAFSVGLAGEGAAANAEANAAPAPAGRAEPLLGCAP